MGLSHSVYFANDSDQDVYVIASLNPDWALIDFLVDAALLAVAVTELKAATTVLELPKELATMKDLYNFAKIASFLVLGTISTGTRTAEAALAVIEAFKKTGKVIPKQDYKDVHSDNMLNYLNADGIAAVLGAETVSVMVMSGDGKQFAMWNTGSDESWIATRSNKIVRSKYGTIWQQDPNSGSVAWPKI